MSGLAFNKIILYVCSVLMVLFILFGDRIHPQTYSLLNRLADSVFAVTIFIMFRRMAQDGVMSWGRLAYLCCLSILVVVAFIVFVIFIATHFSG